MAGSALREIFARFGIEFDSGPLASGDEAVGGVTSRLQGLAQVLGSAAIVVGIRSFVNEMTQLGDELGDTSARLGISAQELQEWRHVAGLSGAEAGEFTASLERLSRQIGEAAGGNQTAGGIFRRLGVDIRDANGELRNTSDVLTDLADPIAALPSQAERTQVLMDLLGRSGARLGPLFSRGSEGIRQARAELSALGGGASEEFVEAAGAMDDATRRLDVSWLSLRSRIAVFLIPAVERLAVGMTAMSAGLARASDRGRLLETTFVAIGVAAAVAGARTIAAWTAAAAPFAALAVVVAGAILVFEDLWVELEGGRGAIGDLGVSFEEFALSIGPDSPLMRGVVGVWQLLQGVIASIVQGIALVAGTDLLGDAAAQVGQEQRPEAALAQALVDEDRQRLGVNEFFLPDTFERFRGLRNAREMIESGTVPERFQGLVPGAVQAAPQVSQTVRIDRIDASGMTEEQAARAVQRGIDAALAAQADDTLDTLAQGGRGA